jgi:transposase
MAIEGQLIKSDGGRPSKYKPEMCEKLLDLMAEGKTDTQTCAMLDISHDSLARYRRQHPELAEAYNKGKLLQQAAWEALGMQIVTGQIKGANATVYIFLMSNLFKTHYTQRADTAVQVNLTNNAVGGLSNEELAEKIKNLQHHTE